ncbi:MAG TPA: OB-fold domain-containing protein [Nevskiaceae bacterium]|nr:OB-fold domain-containing protein [Nevskiaceae bacterium]
MNDLTTPAKVPVLEGWFTLDEREPHLLGNRCTACGTVYFPKAKNFCRNPDCAGEQFEETKLSRTGTLWSYTNASYAPPEPFVAADPFKPFAIAAVELEREKMIVLGPVVDGVPSDALKVGQKMDLVLEALADGKLTWKWKPAS